jgi:hypothetical protein
LVLGLLLDGGPEEFAAHAKIEPAETNFFDRRTNFASNQMTCNAWNHSVSCNCGWGGVFHGNGVYDDPSYWQRADSYTKPNSICPKCPKLVFFYRSPYGGAVYFDELGPPWPKHACMDQGSRTKAIAQTNSNSKIVTKRETGWRPFFCTQLNHHESHADIWVLHSEDPGGQIQLFARTSKARLDHRTPFLIRRHPESPRAFELSSLDVWINPPVEARLKAWRSIKEALVPEMPVPGVSTVQLGKNSAPVTTALARNHQLEVRTYTRAKVVLDISKDSEFLAKVQRIADGGFDEFAVAVKALLGERVIFGDKDAHGGVIRDAVSDFREFRAVLAHKTRQLEDGRHVRSGEITTAAINLGYLTALHSDAVCIMDRAVRAAARQLENENGAETARKIANGNFLLFAKIATDRLGEKIQFQKIVDADGTLTQRLSVDFYAFEAILREKLQKLELDGNLLDSKGVPTEIATEIRYLIELHSAVCAEISGKAARAIRRREDAATLLALEAYLSKTTEDGI